jgi:septum formation topological specificity factor MinE
MEKKNAGQERKGYNRIKTLNSGMIKISALLIMMSLATATFSQDRNGQMDSLCNQLIDVLQKATETDSIKVDLIRGHMGSVSKLEIKITKSSDFFHVECRTGYQFLNGPQEVRTLKFNTKLYTKYQIRAGQLISNLQEEMKAVKTRMVLVEEFYFVRLDANAKSRKFSLASGTGYGLGLLFRKNMLYEQYYENRRAQKSEISPK